MGSSVSSSTDQRGGGSLYVTAVAADSGHYQVIQKKSEKFQ